MAISRNAGSLLALPDFPEFAQAVKYGVPGTLAVPVPVSVPVPVVHFVDALAVPFHDRNEGAVIRPPCDSPAMDEPVNRVVCANRTDLERGVSWSNTNDCLTDANAITRRVHGSLHLDCLAP